jgi:hypothetical protein
MSIIIYDPVISWIRGAAAFIRYSWGLLPST